MRGDVTDAGQQTNNEQTVKIELLSQWKLEAEFRKKQISVLPPPPPSSSSAHCGSDGLGVRTKWLVATTESSSKRGEVALTTDATSPPAGFTPHYRSSTNSQAP